MVAFKSRQTQAPHLQKPILGSLMQGPALVVPPVTASGMMSSYTLVFPTLTLYSDLSVSNGPNSYGASTSLSQHIPTLCSGVQYNLTFTNQISIYGGQPYRDCRVSWSLASTGEIVHIGAPSGEQLPFSEDTRSYVFTYNGPYGSNPKGDTLEVVLSCTAPGGSYSVDDVSLVSLEVYDPGEP